MPPRGWLSGSPEFLLLDFGRQKAPVAFLRTGAWWVGVERGLLGCVLCRPGGDLLSRVLRQSTIGAEEFNGRVRNGIGFRLLAMTTRPAKHTCVRGGVRLTVRSAGPPREGLCAADGKRRAQSSDEAFEETGFQDGARGASGALALVPAGGPRRFFRGGPGPV